MVDSWMASLRWLALFLVLAVVCPGAAQGQKFEGRDLVTAKLVAETATVVPGQPFTAGLLLHMVPGWHTYWQYPGDAGIPTEIKWQLPEGWKAGPIQWPIPLKLNEPGDIQVYGYHDDVLLMVQLTPPPKIDAATVRLAATADWLVCEKICIPGSGEVQLDLPVGAQTTPANQELFTKFRDRLPRALPEAARSALQWSRDAKEFRLTIADKSLAQSAEADFFPLPENSSVVLGHPRREAGPDGSIVFSIPIESADPALKSLAGIIVAGDHAFSLGEAGPAAAKDTPAVAADASGGLAKWLLFGFIGGFILNLMPCVLPVISLKIFGFIQHAGDSRGRFSAMGSLSVSESSPGSSGWRP